MPIFAYKNNRFCRFEPQCLITFVLIKRTCICFPLFVTNTLAGFTKRSTSDMHANGRSPKFFDAFTFPDTLASYCSPLLSLKHTKEARLIAQLMFKGPLLNIYRIKCLSTVRFYF